MKKKILLWGIGLVLFGAIVFGLGRLSSLPKPAQESPPAFSLSPGALGMVSGGGDYTYEFSSSSLPAQDVVSEVQRYLDSLDNSDLTLVRLREFTWAYQAEVVERSTGLHAFDLMVSKPTARVSPKAGPNLFWNTRYGSMIASIGGGYGMVGRLLHVEPASELAMGTDKARSIAEAALNEIGSGLALDEDMATFYGFDSFYVLREGELVGELDVNSYSGQVWYEEWGEPQRNMQEWTS